MCCDFVSGSLLLVFFKELFQRTSSKNRLADSDHDS